MVASMPAPAYAGGMSPGIRVSHGGRAHASCRAEARMQFSVHHRGLKPFWKDILVTILGNLQSTPWICCPSKFRWILKHLKHGSADVICNNWHPGGVLETRGFFNVWRKMGDQWKWIEMVIRSMWWISKQGLFTSASRLICYHSEVWLWSHAALCGFVLPDHDVRALPWWHSSLKRPFWTEKLDFSKKI